MEVYFGCVGLGGHFTWVGVGERGWEGTFWMSEGG